MLRLLFLPFPRLRSVLFKRWLEPKVHVPGSSQRQDFRQPDGNRPNDPTRRDSMRTTLAGFPLILFALSAVAANSSAGCASTGTTTYPEEVVDTFKVAHTSEDGMTLEQALILRADSKGIQLRWHNSVAPDFLDCGQSLTGRRLVRWDYREGASTDARHYRFEVYQEDGNPVGNEPGLTTVLRTGYEVVVLEVGATSASLA